MNQAQTIGLYPHLASQAQPSRFRPMNIDLQDLEIKA